LKASCSARISTCVGDTVGLICEHPALAVGNRFCERVGHLASPGRTVAASERENRDGDLGQPIGRYGAVVAESDLVRKRGRVCGHVSPVEPGLHLVDHRLRSKQSQEARAGLAVATGPCQLIELIGEIIVGAGRKGRLVNHHSLQGHTPRRRFQGQGAAGGVPEAVG
jgi:hypothetical protein